MFIRERITKCLILILSALIIVSCENGNQTNNSNQINSVETIGEKSQYTPRGIENKQNSKGEQLLIYCDLTTSITQESLNTMSDKISQVLLNLPYNSVANLRLIDKNLLGESPFSLITTPPPCKIPETNIKRKLEEANDECHKKDKPFVELVKGNSQLSIVSKIKTLKPQQNSSCIIDTLESAHDFFKGKDKSRYDFRLVFFSDMVEQCYTNSIFICSNNKSPSKEYILKQLEAKFKPNYNLSKLIGNNVSIIITSNVLDNPKNKCLSISDQKDVWEAIFNKVGYTKEDFESFNFTQEIPENLKK